MRVLHVIPSLSPKQGGPSFALPLIARTLARAGVTVDVATTDDDGPGAHLDVPLGERVEHDGYGVFYFRKQLEFYKASWPLRRWLAAHVTDYDLVHVHALFSYPSNCAARFARLRGVPYIIRPLGVLNRWGMQNRRKWLKSLSFRWVEQPILRGAAALHYTSRAEQIEAEECGASAERGIVIPLGIDTAALQNLPGPERFFELCPRARGRELVLFLSRLDTMKGLDVLLPAFAEVKRRHPDAMLVVAGSGNARYVQSQQDEAARLGIGESVLWPGFLDGKEKLSAFVAATVFVLPSHSENFGIALVEALAAGLPCITTEGVAVSDDIRQADAGMVVAAKVEPLVAGLDEMLNDPVMRTRLGANARRLASERFSLAAMGTALTGLYESVVNRGGSRAGACEPISNPNPAVSL